MGTPSYEVLQDALHDFAGNVISDAVIQDLPAKSIILDVGAGWGKYARLLPDYKMDACEAWAPEVVKNELWKLYRQVFIADIFKLEIAHYDGIIMGDVLEHLPPIKAQLLLRRLIDKCKHIYIAVPWLYEQGEVDGNPYEFHYQSDLTPAVMERRYPELELIASDGAKGIYKG